MLKDEVVQGSVEGVYAEEKKAEELRKSEEKFRSIFEKASDCMIFLDVSGRILDVNGKAVEVFGGSREELLGKHFIKIGVISIRDTPTLMSNFANILSGKQVTINISIKNKKGREIPLECSASLMKINGKIASILVIARDITERKRMEKALRESEEKYRNIVELAPDGIATIDMKGVVTSVNTAFSRWTGFSKDELVGKHFTKLGTLRPMEIPKYIKLYSSVLRGKIPPLLEFIYLRKNGTTGWVEAHIGMTKVGDKTAGFHVIARDITERKKTEEALGESEEKYRELTVSISDTFFAMDKDLRYTYWNKASEKLTGISAKDAIGKSLTEVFPDVRGTRVEQFYIEVLRKKQPQSFVNEYQVRGKDYVFEINAYPTKGGLSVFVKDITEQKKMEEILRKSENKSRTLLENLPQKIFFKDRKSVYIAANENYARDLKIKSDEIVGRTDYDFYPKELAEKYRTDDKRIMESGKTEDIEEEYIQDGQRVYVHTVKTPVKDENGNVVGILGIFWDVTERKKTEDALQDAKMKWVSLTENTDDVIIVTDSKGVIQYINRTTPPYTPEETIGKTLYDYVPREQHNVMEKSLREVFKTGKPDKYEVSSNIPKIGTMWFSTKVVPIQQDGKVTGAILISSDITERKRMEDELKRYSEHLEALVEERTRKLKEAQGQLLKAERLAAIGELATMVGHDLRNPLQSIENATFYLNNELTNLSASVPLSQKTTEMLQVINDSINYADKIIKDLQDFSATKPPKLDNTDINAIVKETLSQVQVPKNVELSTELDYLPEMMADKDQITRVFLNLTTNAIQAMENGGTLTISTKKTNGFVEISFKDTGIGISKENMEKIFTPFFTTRAKGMGMGLPICKKFIESHSGSIEVESEVGKGTTFTVKLPIQQGNGGEKQ